jgi:hypothetical protein
MRIEKKESFDRLLRTEASEALTSWVDGGPSMHSLLLCA